MKRIAMLLCMVLALGWISDAGLVTLKYDSGNQIKGIPMRSGYSCVVSYQDVTTELYQTSNKLMLVNWQWVKMTRLGNGWLFEFEEIKGGVPFLPITR